MAFDENELVARHIALAAQTRLAELAAELDGWLRYRLDRPNAFNDAPLESPLEAIFLVWWHATVFMNVKYDLVAQHEIECGGERFRADFALWPMELSRRNEIPLLVELDGHSFHEKTPEQVATRNSRDRTLQLAGYTVLHFSYREMTTNPIQCINDVFTALMFKFEPERAREWQRAFGGGPKQD